MNTDLEALIQSGAHRAALAQLVALHGAALSRFCAAMAPTPADGEELLQEALIAALDAMPSYRGEAGVRAWLFGIARRTCAQALRRHRRRRGLFARWFAPSPPDAASDHLRADARLDLGPALSSLEPRLRDAVLLRYQQGLDAVEVAAILGISHANARKRISLGVQRLRATLGRDLVETRVEAAGAIPADTSAPTRLAPAPSMSRPAPAAAAAFPDGVSP